MQSTGIPHAATTWECRLAMVGTGVVVTMWGILLASVVTHMDTLHCGRSGEHRYLACPPCSRQGPLRPRATQWTMGSTSPRGLSGKSLVVRKVIFPLWTAENILHIWYACVTRVRPTDVTFRQQDGHGTAEPSVGVLSRPMDGRADGGNELRPRSKRVSRMFSPITFSL